MTNQHQRTLAELIQEIPVDDDLPLVPLNIVERSFSSNAASIQLLERIGGPAALVRMTDIFYHSYLFNDSVLDEFVASHGDPHGARLGNYIAQKMNPEYDMWQQSVTHRAAQGAPVHDRTSAHSAAWRSAKRPAHRQGRRFKLDDARIWMRLIFASARDAGLFRNAPFAEWFVRFIGHFVAVYERSAQAFARESARWSEDSAHLASYVQNGRVMHDVVGVPLQQALADLTPEEANDYYWPYR